MKTKRIRKRIIKYLDKMTHGDTHEIKDFLNLTYKHGVTMEALGNVLSDMAKKKEIVKISDYKDYNKASIWGKNNQTDNKID